MLKFTIEFSTEKIDIYIIFIFGILKLIWVIDFCFLKICRKWHFRAFVG